MTNDELAQQYDRRYGARESNTDYSSRRVEVGDRQGYVIHAQMPMNGPLERPDQLSYRYTGMGVDEDILAFLRMGLEMGAVGFWLEVER